MKFARHIKLESPVSSLQRSSFSCGFVQRRQLGVKSYPKGVTTNSDGGIESYEVYYPVFEAMEEVDMVLNLHGEVPSDAAAVWCSNSLRDA